MLRFVALLVLAILIFLVLRAALSGVVAGFRAGVRGQVPSRTARDELVKDPVCETYVPRRSALARPAGAVTYYFCSRACAERFKAPS